LPELMFSSSGIVYFLPLHNHLSSSQVWSARFGFISLGSLTVFNYFVCVRLYSCV